MPSSFNGSDFDSLTPLIPLPSFFPVNSFDELPVTARVDPSPSYVSDDFDLNFSRRQEIKCCPTRHHQFCRTLDHICRTVRPLMSSELADISAISCRARQMLLYLMYFACDRIGVSQSNMSLLLPTLMSSGPCITSFEVASTVVSPPDASVSVENILPSITRGGEIKNSSEEEFTYFNSSFGENLQKSPTHFAVL